MALPNPSGNRMKPGPVQRVKTDAEIYEAAQVGGSAASLLETMGPELDRQLKVLIGKFINAPADLGELLQSQARIGAVWRLRQALEDMARKGRPAIEAFSELLKSKMEE